MGDITGTAPADQEKWWLRPDTMVPMLSAFLSEEELMRLYPQSSGWQRDVIEVVTQRFGRGASLPALPEAGSGRIMPIEEAEVLELLAPVAATIPNDGRLQLSYEWVEIANLIATRAIAGPAPVGTPLPSYDPQPLAYFSLYGFEALVEFPGPGLVFSSAPIEVQAPSLGLADRDHIGGRFRIVPVARPVVVGYEHGRLYLLRGYGRVLKALELGLDRLLCFVRYGLDLDASDLGLGAAGLAGWARNDFGGDRLRHQRPPLVRDFLDPEMAEKVPARSESCIIQITVQNLRIGYGLGAAPGVSPAPEQAALQLDGTEPPA